MTREEDRPAAKLGERTLARVASCLLRRPWPVIYVFFLAAVASIVATLKWLELQTDQNALVSTDHEYHERYMKFLHEFGDQEFLYVVIEVDGRPEDAARLADAIAAEVAQLEEDVEATYHRMAPEALGDSIFLLPAYDREQLTGLVSEIERNQALLRDFLELDRFEQLLGFVTDFFGTDALERDARLAEWGGRLVGILLESMLAAARGEEPAPLEGQLEEVLASERHPRERGYLFSENGELAFVLIMPRKDYETLAVIREPLANIRSALGRARARFPELRFGLTGRPVLQADEMETTDGDMRRATVLALACVLSLFALTFRRLRRPLLAGLSLVVALVLTFGMVSVTIGYLTILSIVFAAMLVGLGIDFGIHFLARYQEELEKSGDVDEAIAETLRTTGVGILIGGLTTAGAFYTAMFVDFKGLQELGFVAGTGVLICLATMLLLLPAVLAVTDRALRRRRALAPPHLIEVPGLDRVPRYRFFVLVALGVPTVLGLASFAGLKYNFNLIELQAEGLESVRYELLISEKSETSTWQAAYVVDSLSEVDAVIAKLLPLRAAGIVGQIESVRDLLAADQDARIAALAPAREIVEALPVPAATRSLDGALLRSALERLLDRLDTAQSQLARQLPDADRAEPRRDLALLEDWIGAVEALIERLSGAPGDVVTRLGGYQVRWFSGIQSLRQRLERMLKPPRLAVESLPRLVRERFVSKDGRFLVYAYPTKDIWTEANMEEFVAATVAVSPQVTGTPLQVYESARLMRQGFIHAALYALAFVLVVLAIDFRSPLHVFLAMVPVLVGLVWLFILMPVFGLDFNLANFFALPILIGCGVDGGVHIVHRFRETGSVAEVGRTTASAVTLSFVTTIAGFGSLSIAHHRGTASLGLVMVLGCATMLVASVLLLPALLETVKRAGRR